MPCRYPLNVSSFMRSGSKIGFAALDTIEQEAGLYYLDRQGDVLNNHDRALLLAMRFLTGQLFDAFPGLLCWALAAACRCRKEKEEMI